jgi:hypothetical protein
MTEDNDIIRQYYLLCTIKNGQKIHVIDSISEKDRRAVIGEKDFAAMFRLQDGHYAANDIVIGGEDERPVSDWRPPGRSKVIVIM